MPRVNTHSATNGELNKVYLVNKKGVQSQVVVLQRHDHQYYVHYVGTDKRMDEWVDEQLVTEDIPATTPMSTNNGVGAGGSSVSAAGTRGRKRKRKSTIANGVAKQARQGSGEGVVNGQEIARGREIASVAAAATPSAPLTEEELDMREHRQITATRNFDKVNFGQWQIKTWYYSPYPMSEAEADEVASASTSSNLPASRVQNVNKAPPRVHGRTSDLLAGALGRESVSGQKAVLWVCDRCFKYMREGIALEVHSKSCHWKHPPGRKVYQRGAHIIWEVDGAKEKLFCQNLSLFGKLFIDIKTLFFDCENFLFYLLTDADSQRDHVLGFFSKEKLSFDDYNLATIVIFPPYQRKRYGMLLIEFSYELSRRAGKLGTPERPLSDLGLRGYLTYWIAALVRFFRRILSINPAELTLTDPQRESPVDPDLLRFIDADVDAARSRGPGRRKQKGWNGELEVALHGRDAVSATSGADDVLYRSMRHTRLSANADGSVTLHVFAKCTLVDISNATGLRVDDIAFTLNEVGFLRHRKALNGGDGGTGGSSGNGENGGEDDAGLESVVVVSREMVEQVAKERNMKRMCMEVQHVLL